MTEPEQLPLLPAQQRERERQEATRRHVAECKRALAELPPVADPFKAMKERVRDWMDEREDRD